MEIRTIPKAELIGLNNRLVNDKMIINNNAYILLSVCYIAAMGSGLFILILTTTPLCRYNFYSHFIDHRKMR